MFNDNTDAKFAHLRDVWFSTSEKKFAKNLIQLDEFALLVCELQEMFKPHELYKIAMGYVNRVDMGECKNLDELLEAEVMISACLIRSDLERTRELILLPDDEEFEKKILMKKHQFIAKEAVAKRKGSVAQDNLTNEDEARKVKEKKIGKYLNAVISVVKDKESKFVDGRELAERRDPDKNGGRGGIESR